MNFARSFALVATVLLSSASVAVVTAPVSANPASRQQLPTETHSVDCRITGLC